MPTFRTMTVMGGRGSSYQADDIEAAAKLAERDGYEVLDLTDDIIVIAE
jgi:hypothetical protein